MDNMLISQDVNEETRSSENKAYAKEKYNLALLRYNEQNYPGAYKLFVEIANNPESSVHEKTNSMFMAAEMNYLGQTTGQADQPERFYIAYRFYKMVIETERVNPKLKAEANYKIGNMIYNGQVFLPNSINNLVEAFIFFNPVLNISEASEELKAKAKLKIASIFRVIKNNMRQYLSKSLASKDNKIIAFRFYREVSNMKNISEDLRAVAKVKMASMLHKNELYIGNRHYADDNMENISRAFKLYSEVLDSADVDTSIKAQAEFGLGCMFYDGQIRDAFKGINYSEALKFFIRAREHGGTIDSRLIEDVQKRLERQELEKRISARRLMQQFPALYSNKDTGNLELRSFMGFPKKQEKNRTSHQKLPPLLEVDSKDEASEEPNFTSNLEKSRANEASKSQSIQKK